VNEYPYDTADLAAAVGVKKNWTVLKRCGELGIGIKIGRRAGWRFSEADKQKLIESMKPPAPVKARRKRRVA
jgi:hypothetical protein